MLRRLTEEVSNSSPDVTRIMVVVTILVESSSGRPVISSRISTIASPHAPRLLVDYAQRSDRQSLQGLRGCDLERFAVQNATFTQTCETTHFRWLVRDFIFDAEYST